MHLVEPLGPRSLRKVVKDLGGVQAQVFSAGEMQCAVRMDGYIPGAAERAIYEQKSIVKAWMMRGTLHWIDAQDFPIWVAANSTRFKWTGAQLKFWKKEFGLEPGDLEPAIEAVFEVLDGRCLTRADLADEVNRIVPHDGIYERLRSGWGEVLKVISSRGGLCFGPNEGRNVTFTRADQWLPKWREEEPEESLKVVLRRYLASHGPATREEFARWWGFTPAHANPVIESIEAELAIVDREGDKAYILKKDLGALQAAREDTELRLLGMFDAYTLAGLPHDPIVPRVKKNLVYRTGAWVWPVVMIGGRVAGVWKADTKKKVTRVDVELFKKRSIAKADLERGFTPLAPLIGGLDSINVA